MCCVGSWGNHRDYPWWVVTERGHACNILFLDLGASYMCQVCEN